MSTPSSMLSLIAALVRLALVTRASVWSRMAHLAWRRAFGLNWALRFAIGHR